MERRRLLDILYQNLPDRTKVQVNKVVTRIEQQTEEKDSTLVYTHDGCVYEADLVVGADGVHSVARAQMWKMAKALRPGAFPESERNSMFNSSETKI